MLRLSKISMKTNALPVIGLMVSALALGACSKEQAQEGDKGRPVLVSTVHYEAQSPERSFVGTIRPRIETDMGFRVPGKVAKRLVEVGQMVDVGQPLATLDEVDLKLQAEQAEAELSAAKGVVSQATAAEGRSKELRTKGWSTEAQLDQVKAAADEARARLNRAERSVELTKNSLSYANLVADARGVVTATLIEPGRWLQPGRQPCAWRVLLKGSRGGGAGNVGRLRQDRSGQRHAMVGAGQEIRGEAARDRAERRSRDTHISGEIFASRRG
jgi:multidrug efflux pump subunit AcrA (membrane-fusion protein)